jgi:hypothetical protein
MTQPTSETQVMQAENDAENAGMALSNAVKEGAADAAQKASEVLPAVGKFLSKAVYGTCYYASYGVTFGALAVAKAIPADSAMSRGFHDGADSAMADFKKRQEQAPPTSPESAVDVAAVAPQEDLASA